MNALWSIRALTRRTRRLGFLFAIGLLVSTSVSAQVVFTVNSALDQVDDNTSDGLCHTTTGVCTLRAAVMQANQMSNAGATIMLPAGTYGLTLGPQGVDGDNNGDLNLTTPASGDPLITITGAGAATTIIDAHNIDRIFNVAASRTAAISGITLRNGFVASSSGGAISNSGDLTVQHSVISHNAAPGDTGGGIDSTGSLTLAYVTLDDNSAYTGGGIAIAGGAVHLSHCALTGNHATNSGGGIFNASYAATIDTTTITGNIAAHNGGGIFSTLNDLSIDHSTLSGNQAGGAGGGIVHDAGGRMFIRRSTLSGNRASDGGGIASYSSLYFINSTLNGNAATGNGGGMSCHASHTYCRFFNSTIAFNEADSDFDSNGLGAGIFTGDGLTEVHNSIIAGNVVQVDQAYEDCSGALDSYGNNKFSNATSADVINCVPNQIGLGGVSPIGSFNELDALQDNGGPTLTRALVPPSTMIDGTDPGVGCVDEAGQPLTTDQRGMPRSVGARCDIGAFEYSDVIFENGFE